MPTLEAHVDPDTESLTISVSDDGKKYEHIEVDADILIQNQQFVTSFERPILTLLTLYQREQQPDTDVEDIAEEDLADLPTQ